MAYCGSTALNISRTEMEALKKQSDGLKREYDRLIREHEKLQGIIDGTHDKKDE